MRNPRLYYCLSIVWFLLNGIQSFGQSNTPSTHGNFSVNYAKGCAPLEVTATNTSGVDPTEFPIVWSVNWDGNLETIEIDPEQTAQEAVASYEEPGTYTILQVIGTNPVQIDTITIEVMEPLLPNYKVYNCVDNSIYVDISQEDYYDQLRIDFGDGTVDTLNVSQQSVIYSYAGGGTYDISVEGIFENAQTNCAVNDTTITTINDLVEADVEQVQVHDQNSIQLDYALPDPNVAYRLEIAENGDADYTFATYELEGSSNSFVVEGLTDTRQNYYCFRVAAVNWCDETLNLYSDTLCSIALNATAGNLVNNLTWATQTATFDTYQLQRDGETLENTDQTSYDDTDVQCQQVYEYQVSAQADGMQSISALIPLTAISTAILPAIDEVRLKNQGLDLALVWAAVPDAQKYYIYRQSNSQPLQVIDSLENGTSYTDQQVATDVEYCYQVTYLDACGNESELSTPVCEMVSSQSTVVFPNAFTPNGDGLNDVFIYKANLIEQIELKIFNRWGELIFYTDQLDIGWDGTYRGTLVPEGSYVYQARIMDQLGNQFQQQGSFMLLHPGR